MGKPTKIALSIPDKPGRHFSFQVKQKIAIEPSEYNQAPRILVVSDIEGNFVAFLQLLLANKVVDKYLKWTFGDGHLVIVGDCFDRGEQVVEVLWLIYSLEEKARKKGGYVHFILGNHEIMNMNGDWRYVHPTYAETSEQPYNALYNGNSELWRWLCSKNIIEKIGKIIFVHGGISNALLKLHLTVEEINSLARPYYNRAHDSFSDPLLHILFNSEDSPFWYRGYYQGDATEDLINETLTHFKATGIVTGHTVVDSVTPFFNGKVINVDTDHASGNSQALLIDKAKYYMADSTGRREKINTKACKQ